MSDSHETFNEIGRMLDANTNRLRDFFHRVIGFFTEDTSARTTGRAPPRAIRLTLAGEPHARLVVKGVWSKREQRFNASVLAVEILWDSSPDPAERDLSRVLVAFLRADGLRLERVRVDRVGRDAAARLADGVMHFLDDPAEVFARSSDRCCICGKKLTDDQSRARGIGPDCLQHGEWLRQLLRVEKGVPA
jgi:hypothetical protein